MNRVRPTSALLVAALIGAGLVVGRLLPALVVRFGGTVPRLGWVAPMTLLFAALVVGGFAWNTWQSLHKRHERMTSDHAIKMLSLAKSCAVVGALVAGIYGGFAIAYLDVLDSPLGQERAVRGGASAVASTLLLVAALLLERACRLPGGDDDEEGTRSTSPKRRPDADPTPA